MCSRVLWKGWLKISWPEYLVIICSFSFSCAHKSRESQDRAAVQEGDRSPDDAPHVRQAAVATAAGDGHPLGETDEPGPSEHPHRHPTIGGCHYNNLPPPPIALNDDCDKPKLYSNLDTVSETLNSCWPKRHLNDHTNSQIITPWMPGHTHWYRNKT